MDDLPLNVHVPEWMMDLGDGYHRTHYGCGDVFLVKMAAHDNIVPEFLGFLAEGPLENEDHQR